MHIMHPYGPHPLTRVVSSRMSSRMWLWCMSMRKKSERRRQKNFFFITFSCSHPLNHVDAQRIPVGYVQEVLVPIQSPMQVPPMWWEFLSYLLLFCSIHYHHHHQIYHHYHLCFVIICSQYSSSYSSRAQSLRTIFIVLLICGEMILYLGERERERKGGEG